MMRPPYDVSAVRVSSCAGMAASVAEGSLDAIFTDPPYPREFLPCYSELAEFAVHALRPGGLLMAMAGHLHLPAILDLMRVPGLSWRWMIAYNYQKPRQMIHCAKVSVGWKPFLVYAKDGGPSPDAYSQDAFKIPPRRGDDKAAHHWGQSVGGAKMVAEEWLRPGWRVCDPFVGAGSLLIAASLAGCEVSGCDIDPRHVETTRRKWRESYIEQKEMFA